MEWHMTRRRTRRSIAVGALLTAGIVGAAFAGRAPIRLVAQTSGPTNSMSIGLWTPTKWDTCSQALHDTFSVIGPDNKRYPTWHPPSAVDPETGRTCTFGHEHGRDPSGSALWAQIQRSYGGVLFGYANEQLDVFNQSKGIINGMRHEDHVGHKIEWENDVPMFESTTTGGANRRALAVTCDFLMKIHQGTHSKDAFTNNMHELLYAMQCHDGANGGIGTKVIVTKMVLFGDPGSFSEGSPAGGFKAIAVGAASPANSPAGPVGTLRSLPTVNRIRQSILVPPAQWSQFSLGLYEDWISANYLTAGSTQLAYFDPHFAVFSPSRYYDPSYPDALGRSIDVCWKSEMVNGTVEKARGGECDRLTNDGALTTPIPYDDPRSPFNGLQREFYFNNTVLTNDGRPEQINTNPFGAQASRSPFSGSIKQFVAAVDNRRRTEDGRISRGGRVYSMESVAIGKTRYYGDPGVHAPN
jgi:hypothetical protein